MSIDLGLRLRIRSMIRLAAEPIPFFWPMRTFIHHNPLHGLEDLPFPEAAAKGAELFHGRAYLPRSIHQHYLHEGKVSESALQQQIAKFVAQHQAIDGIDLEQWLMQILTKSKQTLCASMDLVNAEDIHAQLHQQALPEMLDYSRVKQNLADELLKKPVYEVVDHLYGTHIGTELDELVIKSCLDFFDEGQSVWAMPEREKGFFEAWRTLATNNLPFILRGIHIKNILAQDETPEGIIAYVLKELGIAKDQWADYFTHELSRLHGWVGFIRWRSHAKRYHWRTLYHADLIDFMAIRLVLTLALLSVRKLRHTPHQRNTIATLVEEQTAQVYLRYELHTKQVLPAMAHQVEQALARGNAKQLDKIYTSYLGVKREAEAAYKARCLSQLAKHVDASEALERLSVTDVQKLWQIISDLEQQEGLIWLQAMEDKAMEVLLSGVRLNKPQVTELSMKPERPFAQALFCIDTRSERVRRHLEAAGDYQTFGIAGFFGVPVSFIGLGKGSETHLCPVILTPQNVVVEMSAHGLEDTSSLTALEKGVHELKESVLTPFVTVEAIGLLFGFDMIGKTLAPRAYHHWLKRLHNDTESTHLLLDKLSRQRADSIIRTVQRAVIEQVLIQEMDLKPEDFNDDMVRQLREAALKEELPEDYVVALAVQCKLKTQVMIDFIQRLRDEYQINPAFVRLQLERLGRIGFSLKEQVSYVSQALQSIGLNGNFSRFVLLIGHGSKSENNPYESALDCGACGGNHGVVSGRVLAQMANSPQVRRQLCKQGIDIPDDTWFLPAFHNTTTDELQLFDLEQMPAAHLMYLDRLHSGLTAASRLAAQERMATLVGDNDTQALSTPLSAARLAQRNAIDWSQVRPEWGLSRNAYFVIAKRSLTKQMSLDGRAFLHSYDYRIDPNQRLLENIITGPLVVGQWINMEHYFSAVDNERFGSGSKVYHNVAGRFGVMTGNISDLRTGLPSQTVLKDGLPYHQPIRLITLIEAPLEHVKRALDAVISVKNLVKNAWIRLLVIDPETGVVFLFKEGEWQRCQHFTNHQAHTTAKDTHLS